MQLCYVYIEEYRNIIDEGFNLSNKYTFYYNKETKELSCKIRDSYIQGFYGEAIENLCCLIGENGSGKSNLIDYLLSTIRSGILITKKESFFIFEDDSGSFKVYQYGDYINKVPDGWQIYCNENTPDFTMIYYSSLFNGKKLPKDSPRYYMHMNSSSYGNFNISTESLAYIDYGYSIDKSDYAMPNKEDSVAFDVAIEWHRIADINRIAYFLADNYNEFQEDIKLPQYMHFTPRLIEKNEWEEEVEEWQRPIYKLLQQIKPLFNEQNESILSILYANFFIAGILNLLMSKRTRILNSSTQENTNRLTNYINILSIEIQKNGILDPDLLLKHYNILNPENKENEFAFTIFKIIKQIKEIEERIRHNSSQKKNTIYAHLSLDGKELDFSTFYLDFNDKDDSVFIKSFLDSYLKDHFRFVDFINFEFSYSDKKPAPFSTGEDIMFSLFGRLDFVSRNINRNFNKGISRYLFLIVDEGEVGFHAEWQRKYLNYLVTFINKLFKDFRIQIVITSHSPILVSDIPKEHIIFLKKGVGGICKIEDNFAMEKTFGGNIYSLYRNSFFLEGLPIGEFAKRKIQSMFERLNEKEYNSSLLKEIDLVAEPLLKKQLVKMLEGKNIDARIIKLKAELDELTKMKKS